jgi:hypothetical protein
VLIQSYMARFRCCRCPLHCRYCRCRPLPPSFNPHARPAPARPQVQYPEPPAAATLYGWHWKVRGAARLRLAAAAPWINPIARPNPRN